MSNSKDVPFILNEEIENILNDPNEKGQATKYLRRYFRWIFLLRCIKWAISIGLFITILCSSIYYVPILNWNASAIGRLMLIKWILPFYNWQHLYTSRCLIETFQTQPPINHVDHSSYNAFNDNECAICENFVAIDRVSNTSFGYLQTVYLSRDLPVIISDSHDVWPNQNNVPDDFIEFLQTLPNFEQTVPCNTATNLLKWRKEAPSLRRLFEQAKKFASKEWFLHFRNCDFDGVKASRGILPLKKRPYFMPSHLPPFHSSWILMSNQYQMANKKQLPVRDLVFVLQLKGSLEGQLAVRKKCTHLCVDLEFQLNSGESLIFNAEMYELFYYSTANDSQAQSSTISFVQEINSE